jgi:predicted transcriptional regulator
MPVLAGRENVGSLQEEDILRATLDDQTVLERTVSALLGPAFAEVGQDAPIGEILKRLRTEKALLVRDTATRQPLGVLTRHDILSFLSLRGGLNAV